jgi:hypothetical protein
MNSTAESFTVLWGADVCEGLIESGEIGKPLTVIFGGEHQSIPSLSRFKVKPGDHVFPIRLYKRCLYVIARLTISKIIPLEEYFATELCVSKDDLRMNAWDLQDKLLKEQPEMGHRLPYGCVFEAGLGHGTPMTLDRVVPPATAEKIRYCSRKGERPIKHITNGQITHASSISGGVYRLSPDSAKFFHALVGTPKRRHNKSVNPSGG